MDLALVRGAQIAGAGGAPGRYEGVLGNARYLINVPADWNGGLVMFAHGYEGEGSGRGSVLSEPLADHLAERGYALAASGYRAWGYRPDWFLLDMLALDAQNAPPPDRNPERKGRKSPHWPHRLLPSLLSRVAHQPATTLSENRVGPRNPVTIFPPRRGSVL